MFNIRIDRYDHSTADLDVWRKIIELKEYIMASNQEFVAQLHAIAASVDSISARVDAIKAASGQTTPEEDAAIAAVKAKIDALAALVA